MGAQPASSGPRSILGIRPTHGPFHDNPVARSGWRTGLTNDACAVQDAHARPNRDVAAQRRIGCHPGLRVDRWTLPRMLDQHRRYLRRGLWPIWMASCLGAGREGMRVPYELAKVLGESDLLDCAFDHDEAITAGVRLPSFYRFLAASLAPSSAFSASRVVRRSRKGCTASLISASVNRGVTCCGQFQSNAMRCSSRMRSGLAL